MKENIFYSRSMQSKTALPQHSFKQSAPVATILHDFCTVGGMTTHKTTIINAKRTITIYNGNLLTHNIFRNFS
jgi:hypothetical protein